MRPSAVGRWLVAGLLSAAIVVATADRAPATTAVPYQLPVATSTILRPFEPPTTAYGPGHRGVDLDVAVGTVVRAAAPGRVRHAGPVAGTTWVSVEHPDGIVTTYGPVTALHVRVGTAVGAGAPLAHLAAGGHGHEHADRGLHWGARRGTHYLDPLSLLGRSPRRPSLVGPGGWSAPAPAASPRATREQGRAVDAPGPARLP